MKFSFPRFIHFDVFNHGKALNAVDAARSRSRLGLLLRKLEQKVRGFFEVLREITTVVESKYLNHAKLR